jgi:hypothetical protein
MVEPTPQPKHIGRREHIGSDLRMNGTWAPDFTDLGQARRWCRPWTKTVVRQAYPRIVLHRWVDGPPALLSRVRPLARRGWEGKDWNPSACACEVIVGCAHPDAQRLTHEQSPELVGVDQQADALGDLGGHQNRDAPQRITATPAQVRV